MQQREYPVGRRRLLALAFLVEHVHLGTLAHVLHHDAILLGFRLVAPAPELEARKPAFVVCGLAPLLPYLFGSEYSLTLSVTLTGIVFVVIGSIKSRWSTASWWRSGLTTLLVGAIAAALAYVAGLLSRRLLA